MAIVAAYTYVPELALSLEGRRECDGVMEGQAEGLVSLVAALVIEQVVL